VTLPRREGTPEGRADRAFHERRYRFLLETVAGLVPERNARTLVVGPSFETALLRERFPHTTIDTPGISDAGFGFAPRSGEQHIDFDLNQTVKPGEWPALSP
jgi:hypothetical protein